MRFSAGVGNEGLGATDEVHGPEDPERFRAPLSRGAPAPPSHPIVAPVVCRRPCRDPDEGLFRGWRHGRLRNALLLAAVAIGAVLAPAPSSASVVGDPPVLYRQYEVRGSANVVGNTVMSYEHDPRINSLLLDPQWTRSELRNVPLDATVEGAYVFYSARMDQQVDHSFQLHRPDGAVRTLFADQCVTLVQFGETFYYCRRDVTAELSAVEAAQGHLNGFYNVHDFDARPGVLGNLSNGCDISDINCQAAYGGWSLVIFWSSPSYPKVRNLNLYDGFLAMYEDNTSGISPPIQLSGFNVGEPAVGEIAFFALEGDPHLGHPPLGPEWADFMYFIAEDGTAEKLQDAVNPPDNLFNSTVPDSGVFFNGIDLDRFDIGEGGMGLLSPGQTSAWIQPGSGDGNPNYQGEFFILAWVMLAIDTVTPSFDEASSKVVDRTVAAAGDTLTYTITVENTGSQIATDVVVEDSLPSGTVYVPGSTTLDGQPVPDDGGESALFQGLNIGTLDFRPGTVRRQTITWTAQVASSVSDGAQICNTATVDAAEGAFTQLVTDPCTTVSAPDLVDPPLLSVTGRDGDPIEPGHRLRYRAMFSNDGAQPARNLSYQQDLPPYVRDLDVVSVPSGSNDASVSSGGANGTGVIEVTGITVPGAFTVEIVYDVVLYDYQELIAAGVPPADVDGLVISAQGTLDAPWLAGELLTDDPATPTWPDSTDVVLSWTTDLSTSSKTGTDVDGGLLEPGDLIAYEIAVRNTGRAPATTHLADDLPEGVEDCVILEAPEGATCTSAGGANDTGRLTAGDFVVAPGETVHVRFTVRVRDDAPDGTIVQNHALLTADESHDTVSLWSQPLEVFARPLLHTSTKAVVGHQNRLVEPGDELFYTIEVVNTGNRPATNVIVQDELDPALSLVNVGQGGSLAGPYLVWEAPATPSLSSLPPGESVSLTYTVQVASPLDDGTIISNQGEIFADEVLAGEVTGDADTADPDDPTVVTVTSAPSLQTTTKAVSNLDGSLDEVRPGHTLLYTVTVRNTGNAVARDVVVTDPIDQNLTAVTPLDGGSIVGDELRWTVGDVGLSPGGDVVIRFEATVALSLPDGTVIPNQAFVTAAGIDSPVPSGDPRSSELGDPTIVTVTSDAVLLSTKSVTDLDGGATMPGDRLEYRIVLTSAGDAPVRDITVVDPIEQCLTDVQPFDGGSFDGSTITWTPQTNTQLGSLHVGQSVELRFRATVAPGTPDGTACANQAVSTSSDLSESVLSGDPATPALDDPTIIIIESRPVLEESTKAVSLLEDRSGNGAYSPGDRIRYTLVIRNTGTEAAANVVVTDPLPEELTEVTASGSASISGGTVTWSLGNLAAGDSVTLHLDGDLVRPLDDGTIVENQASVDFEGAGAPVLTGDPSTPEEADPTRITLVSEPVLETTTKAVSFPDGEPTRPGHLLDYEITVRNTGTSLARDVVVTDVLDENLELVSAGQGASYDLATRTVTWSLGTLGLSPEDDETLTLRVRLDTPLDNGTVIDNQALVSALELPGEVPSGDPRTPVLGDPTRVIVVAGSDLTTSTKVVNAEDGVASPGQLLTWTIVVSNEGDAVARNVVVTDPLDPNLIDVSPGQGGVLSQGELSWDAGTTPALAGVAPGETVALTFTSKVVKPLDDGTVIENQAWIDADDLAQAVPSDDPATPAPFDPTRVTIESAPALHTSTKSPSVDSARPGDTISWTIVLANTGDMVARDLVVIDPLDPNLEFVSAGSGGAYDADEHAVTWTVDELLLAASGWVELQLETRVVHPLDDGTVVANQAFVHEPNLPDPVPTGDPRTPVNGDPTEVPIEAQAVLALTKLAENLDGGPGPGRAEPEDRIRYTFTIENDGDMVAWGTELSDLIDAALVDVSVEDGGTFDEGQRLASWPAVDVVPGAPVEMRLIARVAPLTAGGTEIENQALAQGAGLSVVSSDASNPGGGEPTLIEVVAAPVLSTSTKAVGHEGGGLLRPGDLVDWTIVVRNTGNTYATDVVVEDPLDEWLTDVQPGQGGVVEGDIIRWDAATTPALASVSPEDGGEVQLSFTARVGEGAPDGTVISNQAFIRSAELDTPAPTGDPATPDPDDPTEIMVSYPVIVSTKSVSNQSGGEVSPGDVLRWTIELRNEGSRQAMNVVVRDPIDQANLVEVTPEDGGTFDGESIQWSLGTIGAGRSRTVSFTSRVRPLLPDGTVIENQAFVSLLELDGETPSHDPDTPALDDPTRVIVVASPDFLGSTKAVENLTGADEQVKPGDRLRYTLVFTNIGNTLATDVEIRDLIDPNLEDVTLDPPGVLEAEIATWTASVLPELSSVAPEDVVIVHIEGTVRRPLEHGTLIRNQALLVSAESEDGWSTGDPRTPAVSDPTIVEVWSAPRFSRSEKSVANLDGSVDAVAGGDQLEYTILVVNDGTEDATGVNLIDSVPTWTSYVRGSTTLNGQPVPDGLGGASPLAEGILVRSARPGTPPGTVLVDDGSPPDDEVAVVVFRVRVDEEVPGGTVISNQGFIRCDRTTTVGTGDPRTPEFGDPTLAFVGEVLHLSGTTKTWRLVEDLGTPGVVEPGDAVAYDIMIINRGNAAATDVVFTDTLPEGAGYIEGTLALDGRPLTEQDDGDGGSVIGDVVRVEIPELEPGARAHVELAIRVGDDAPPTLVNQGVVEAIAPGGERIRELTDADPSTPGAQPTVIPIGEAPVRDLSTSTKSVADIDGGRVEPGDLLRYTITVRNTGNVALRGVRALDDVPEHTTFVRAEVPEEIDVVFDAPPAGEHGRGHLTFHVDRPLEPGESLPLSFLVRIDHRAPRGTIVENFAIMEAEETEPARTDVVRLIVGGAPGTGGLMGRVYRDLEGTGWFNEGDPVFPGFRVVAKPLEQPGEGEPETRPIETIVDEEGRYLLLGLAPEEHRLRFESPTGTRFVELATEALEEDEIAVYDGLIDPSGVVYRAGSTEAIPGAGVWLLYDDSMLGQAPLPCDEDQRPIDLVDDPTIGASDAAPLPRPVGAGCLPEGQQGQLTPQGEAEGYYRFDVPPSDPATAYRLSVVSPAPRLAFPSMQVPPSPGFAPPGPAVDSPTPDPEGPTDYWLRFSIATAEDEVTNNHVPLDSLESLVSVRKMAGRSTASVGELVPYTVTVTNRSGQDMLAIGGVSGGLAVRDLVPDGMRYVRGSSRADRLAPGAGGPGERLCPRLGEEEAGCPSRSREPASFASDSAGVSIGEILEYGPYDLPAGQSLEIRYTLVVAADATFGERTNRASALLDNVFLAEGRAAVRIIPDPLFDLATLYGKVYCDENADGNQDPGDRGLPGVRVHADMGHHAVTDGSGKWHLQRVPAGMRLLKVDERTLPPGVRLLEPASRAIYVTPGLDTTMNWRASCDLEQVAPGTVDVLVEQRPPEVTLSGNAHGLGMTVAEEPVRVIRADVLMSTTPDRPRFRDSDGAPPDVSPLDDLYFHTEVTGPIADWRLVMAELRLGSSGRSEPREWAEVFSTGGEGRPPDFLHLPEGASELDEQGLYAYWLLVVGEEGVAARSPVRTMGVGLASPSQEPLEVSLDETGGPVFQEDDSPSRSLRDALRPVVDDLAEVPERRVAIEVHVDASHGDRAAALSEARAAALRDWLLGAGLSEEKVEVAGVGSSSPAVPNIGARNQARNRRVEISVTEPPGPSVEVPRLTFEPRAVISGVGTVVPDDRGAFRLRLPVPSHGRVIAGLRRADGATLGTAFLVDQEGRLLSVEGDPETTLAAYARAAAEGEVPEAAPEPSLTPRETAPDDEAEEGPPPRSGPRRYAVRLHLPGDVDERAHVEVAGRRVELPLLQVGAAAEESVLRLDEEGAVSLTFETRAPRETASWRLEMGVSAGEPAIVASGEGRPPESIDWDGGGVDLRPGTSVGYRLRVEDAAGNEARSAPGFLSLAAPESVELHRDLVDESEISARGMDVLRALVDRVLAAGEGTTVKVRAHTDPSDGEAAAQERTDAIARAIARALRDLGVPEGGISAEGRGAGEPMVPNLNPRNRALNNRVVLELQPAAPLPPVLQSVARVVVGEVEARREGETEWLAGLEEMPDELRLELVTDDGREAIYRVELPLEARRRSSAGDEPAHVVRGPAGSRSQGGDEAGAGGGTGLGWLSRLLGRGEGGSEDIILAQGTLLGGELDDPPLIIPLLDPEPASGEPDRVEGEEPPPVSADPREKAAPSDEEALREEQPKRKIVLVHENRPISEVDLSAVPAARTLVHLPAEGAVIRSSTLGLAGHTAPGNTAVVNGKEVDVGRDGHFFAVVDLPRGESTVVVQVVDPEGNEATISREVRSEPDGLFLLAMADAHAGPTGAELAGVTDRSSIGLGPAYLYGRGVAYARGAWRLEQGPFEDLSLTLHLDSAKEREASYFADLVSPERHYPIYGDAGEEVQDVAAMGPLFISAKADANELRIGNFQTDPGIGGLFRYRRSFYGARLALDQPHLDGALRSRAEVFVAGDPAGIRPGHVVLQGTGGSLYFLRHRDLVEGSERVRVVVRDRDTGTELMSRPLSRNIDYVVRHREGHVMLMSPLPSVVEAGWMAGMNLSSTLDGHPVFLVVDYEHLVGPGEGGFAAGGYVTETFFDWLRVGGGLLSQDDGFGADPYRLWGLSAEARPMPRTFLRAELARSSGADVGGFYSADGGLSYASLLPECLGAAESSPLCRDGGNAYKLEAGATLGDILGGPDDVVRAGFHLHYQDRGFYGSQLLLDHGQRRVGATAEWDISESDTLSGRVDRVASDVPIGAVEDGTEPSREVVRGYGGLRYQRKAERWRAAGEWAHGRVSDPAMEAGAEFLSTHRLAAGGEYDATESLALVLEQDLVLGGDPRLFERWNDRLTTTAGARWLLTESLRLSALGQLRWNGENSALVGAEMKMGERGSVYARQRLTRLPGGAGWRSQSVFGGEQEVLAGIRSYGEYQLDGGMSGTHGRAVLGMSNVWRPREDLTLGLSYERVQVLGDPGQAVVPGAGLDPVTGRAATSGRADGLPPFDAVGMNPAGAFYPGAVSRDAASASIELLTQPLKASGKLELRHDNADPDLAGTMPGVADRLQTVALANTAWTWTRDLAAIGRLHYAGTLNRTRRAEGLEGTEALWFEATGGVAFRPESYDWVNILGKYTRLIDQRPLDLTVGMGDRHSSHVLSLAPVIRTPWRATLTEKVAYKHTRMRMGLGEEAELRPPEATAHTILWINRLDLHVLPRIDLTGEYRVLWVGAEDAAAEGEGRGDLSATVRSGLVLEVAWRAAESFRLGVGYSFARFGDDELSRFDRDERGPFLRVTGMY